MGDIKDTHGNFSRPLERILEASQALEVNLLGCILTHDRRAHHIIGLLKPAHFAHDFSRQMFEIIQSLKERGEPINPFSIKRYAPEGLQGKEIVNWAATAVSSTYIHFEDADGHIRQLKDLYAERRILEVQNIVAKEIASGIPASEAYAEANLVIADILAESKDVSAENAPSTVFDGVVSIFDEMANGTRETGVKTRIREINDIFGDGLQRGGLYIVAGRPAMGKSAFATSVFLPEMGSKEATLFFSLEMTKRELNARILSEFANERKILCSYKDILSGKTNHYVQQSLMKHVADMRDIPFIIDDNSHQTIDTIKARVSEYIALFKSQDKTLSTIVIDHIGLVTPNNRYAGNKVNELGEITRAFKAMAKDFNVAVVALCQLNRGVEKQTEKRPQLADLRGSGDIEQDANAVIALYREAYYNAEKNAYEGTLDELEAIVLKNRSGECKTIKLFCDLQYNVIRGLV